MFGWVEYRIEQKAWDMRFGLKYPYHSNKKHLFLKLQQKFHNKRQAPLCPMLNCKNLQIEPIIVSISGITT